MMAPRIRPCSGSDSGSGSGQARDRGFTLIEALVSLVILSVGLLGVLGMRMASFKNTANANARAAASVHAADMLDRLRANPQRAMAGDYNLTITQAAPATNAGTIAAQDLAQWRSALAANLANGNGSVQVGVDGQAVVVVQWIERDQNADNGHRGYTFTFRTRL
jgi:type IV pilus assembly protein PilV